MALLKTNTKKQQFMYKLANISDYHSAVAYLSKKGFSFFQVLVIFPSTKTLLLRGVGWLLWGFCLLVFK